MSSMEIWRAYASGDQAARNRLLNEHLGLVHHVARKLAKTLAVEVDFDELLSAGAIGLMNALDRFEPERGLSFSTYAAPRIRGAILDELRRQDTATRSTRRKTRDLAHAREALMRSLGRMPEDRELAEHLGVDVETLWRWKADVDGATCVRIDPLTHDHEERGSASMDLASQETPIDELLGQAEDVEMLRDALKQLTEQERTVLTLYYYEELKLSEIAQVLGLTESRISQVRSKAIGKLRATMATAQAA